MDIFQTHSDIVRDYREFIKSFSRSIMDSIAQAVLFSPGRAKITDLDQLMLSLDELDETKDIKLKVSQKIEEAERREKLSRSIFAQHGIKADELEKDLKEADEFIGNPQAVHEFVTLALSWSTPTTDSPGCSRSAPASKSWSPSCPWTF